MQSKLVILWIYQMMTIPHTILTWLLYQDLIILPLYIGVNLTNKNNLKTAPLLYRCNIFKYYFYFEQLKNNPNELHLLVILFSASPRHWTSPISCMRLCMDIPFLVFNSLANSSIKSSLVKPFIEASCPRWSPSSPEKKSN